MNAAPCCGNMANCDRAVTPSAFYNVQASSGRGLCFCSMQQGVSPRNGAARQLELVMRLIGNFYSEWAHDQGNFRHILLVTLVACAVGGIASAAVILSLASSPMTQPGAPSISPRAIVRNVGASELPKAAQDGPVVETTPRPAATGMVANRDEAVTQMEPEHQTEVRSHQSRKHGRVRGPYWRRFSHYFSSKPFGSW
jgi:hypothetical protein